MEGKAWQGYPVRYRERQFGVWHSGEGMVREDPLGEGMVKVARWERPSGNSMVGIWWGSSIVI